MAEAVAYVERQNNEWDHIRAGRQPAPVKRYGPGTYGAVVERFRKSTGFRKKKQPVTVDEFERAMVTVLEAFGDYPIADITLDHCEDFYRVLTETGSVDRAARVMKWFRNVSHYAVAAGHIGIDPSALVVVEQPTSRDLTWSREQVRRVRDRAWRDKQYGLAAAIVILHDLGLRPGDVRHLTLNSFETDNEGHPFVRLITGKTQTPALLWLAFPETLRIVERYRKKLEVIPMP